MTKKILYLLFFLLIGQTKSYPIFDLYGDIPYFYNIEFNGELIIESQFFTYTNKNTQFSFDLCATSSANYQFDNQEVFSWRISLIKNSNAPFIFNKVWNALLQGVFKDVVYSVKLSNDQFLVFDKFGKQHPSGYYMQLLFPIIPLQQGMREFKINLPIESVFGGQRGVKISVNSWDFFRFSNPTQDQTPLLNTNTQFIDKIYKCYELQNRQNRSFLYWVQDFNTIVYNAYQQNKGSASFIGMYFIDLKRKLMSHASVISELSIELPVESNLIQQIVRLKWKGQFDIRLNTNALPILQEELLFETSTKEN